MRFLRTFFFFFFNPTIEVVTVRLRGWYMLGVFLLPAFTRLGHECQDLLSPCDGMHVCTDRTSVYSLIRKKFGGMESEPMLTPREKSPLPEKNYPLRRIEPTTLHHAGQRAQHTVNELFRPPYTEVADQSCCLTVTEYRHLTVQCWRCPCTARRLD